MENVHNSVLGTESTTSANGIPIVGGLYEPVGSGQHGCGLEGLRGKLGAALAAAVGQDGTTGTGAHAKTETMNLCTATVVGLEGSLAHGWISAM